MRSARPPVFHAVQTNKLFLSISLSRDLSQLNLIEIVVFPLFFLLFGGFCFVWMTHLSFETTTKKKNPPHQCPNPPPHSTQSAMSARRALLGAVALAVALLGAGGVVLGGWQAQLVQRASGASPPSGCARVSFVCLSAFVCNVTRAELCFVCVRVSVRSST